MERERQSEKERCIIITYASCINMYRHMLWKCKPLLKERN